VHGLGSCAARWFSLLGIILLAESSTAWHSLLMSSSLILIF
jgi:hypothetical protein